MEKDQLSRKLAVILHADVADSTALVRLDETLAHKRFQDTFRRFSEIISNHDGVAREIRGDALVAEFARASDAVSASLAFQATNATHNDQLSDDLKPVLRIGIAMGEVVIADNTVTGEGVVLAQRLEQLAEQGGLCIQGAAYETLPKRLPFEYENLGEQQLKGFDDPVKVFAVSLKPGEVIPDPRPKAPSETSKPAISEKPSIAVLPFTNMSGDPQQEYFSDGFTESIILSLSYFKGLKIKSRHASFAFKNSSHSIKELARELGVQYIVEGSIRKFGDSIRITVSLDDANNGNQLWGKRFDSKLEDMFLLEEELTRTIAGTISGRIGENLISVSLHKPPKDMQSYDYLMRGKYHFEKCNNKDNFIARDLFEKCLELEPNNLEAHAYIAYTHYADLLDNWSDDRKLSKDLYRQYVEKALDLDPDNAFARGFMADFHLFFGDLEHAALHVEKAIELNPTLPDGYYLKGILLALTRRYEEAVEYAEMSLKIDPHQPYSRWFSGEIYRSAGKYDRAIELFRSMSHIPPSVHGQIAACLAGLGKFDEARAEMKLYLELARDQMPNYPETEEAWRTIWYEYLAYLYEEDSKILFDLLLKAGLCDSL